MRHSALRPKGFVEFMDPDGPSRHGETLQCCHCGMHWIIEPGSGRVRGFCMRCNQVTCGAPGCDPCVPYEQKLENIEAGRDEMHRPVRSAGGFEMSPGGVIF